MSDVPEPESTTALATEGAPRWVKVLGILVLLVVVGALIFMLTGGVGGHSPARHGSLEQLGHSRAS